MKTFEAFLNEKNLSDNEIEDLISRAMNAVEAVLSDKNKTKKDTRTRP